MWRPSARRRNASTQKLIKLRGFFSTVQDTEILQSLRCTEATQREPKLLVQRTLRGWRYRADRQASERTTWAIAMIARALLNRIVQWMVLSVRLSRSIASCRPELKLPTKQ